jgi:hypothetical protein
MLGTAPAAVNLFKQFLIRPLSALDLLDVFILLGQVRISFNI